MPSNYSVAVGRGPGVRPVLRLTSQDEATVATAAPFLARRYNRGEIRIVVRTAMALWAACLTPLFCLVGAAATQERNGSEATSTIRTEVRMVILPVRVLDQKGWPLEPELPQSAFSVYEDGVSQMIRVFAREDAPASIGLVIDHSGSMSYKLDTVAEAAANFVRSSNPEDEIFVVSFSQTAQLSADFTNNQEILKDAIRGGTMRGDTAIWDAVSFSIRHMDTFANRGRRILIVISDGDDIASSVTLPDLVRKAQAAEVAIYAFGCGTNSRRDRAALQRLAEATGGHAFLLKKTSDLDDMLRRLARDVRRQYTIGYGPSTPETDASCHSVSVKLNGGLRATVHTRTAYCASAQ